MPDSGYLSFAKSSSASLGAVPEPRAAAASLAVWYGLDEVLGRGLAAQVVSLASAFAVAGLAYFGCARLLRVRELEALLLLRRER